jgi:hypothetical protein
MIALRLLATYERLRQIGLVRSKRDFAQRWLGRGKTYLRDYEYKIGRDAVRVSARTVEKLHARIAAVAARVPAGVASDLHEVMCEIERDARVADTVHR